jgi:hypothetical protein
MLRHTYDHDTRMTSQVHKNNYDQQPEIDPIRSANTLVKRTRQHWCVHMNVCVCLHNIKEKAS